MVNDLRAPKHRLGTAAIAVTIVVLIAVGCGGDDDDDSSQAGDGEQLQVAWLHNAPQNDNGYNQSFDTARDALAEEFGVENVVADNTPYSEEAGQTTQRLIDDGADVIVDAMSLAEVLTDVCADNPDVHCLNIVPQGELPENTTGFWHSPWLSAYQVGVVAGLTTDGNIKGYVNPGETPVGIASANGYLMGCRSVNPDCEVRQIVINEYFNPPVSSQAANTLIDAGADFLFGMVDDPSPCTVAQERGVRAIGYYVDWTDVCSNAVTTSVKWDFSQFFEEQIGSILDETWQQEDLVVVPSAEMLFLGEWNADVPKEAQQQAEETFASITAEGGSPFVGPIMDNTGKLRVKDGVEMSYDELYAWDWYVDGVVSEGGK